MSHFCLGFDCLECVLLHTTRTEDAVDAALADTPVDDIVARDDKGWYVLPDVDGPRYKTKFGALLQVVVETHQRLSDLDTDATKT